MSARTGVPEEHARNGNNVIPIRTRGPKAPPRTPPDLAAGLVELEAAVSHLRFAYGLGGWCRNSDEPWRILEDSVIVLDSLMSLAHGEATP